MEIGLDNTLPTYAGGLGIVAGDTIYSAADQGISMAAVTLLYRKGHFRQTLEADGTQREEPVTWPIENYLKECGPRAQVEIAGRKVTVRAWEYQVKGHGGFVVPVYFLDTDLPENSDVDRGLTDVLYGGDERYRISQEVILGIGGVRVLRAMGYDSIERFHMNEGHAAFLVLELLQERLQATNRTQLQDEDLEAVRKSCVFTTHTPVAAGHDQFPLALAHDVLSRCPLLGREDLCSHEGKCNMTYLALRFSRYVNGVAKKHAEVTRNLFTEYPIDSITNGVHAVRWTSEPFQAVYDRYIPGWRQDHSLLRYAIRLPRRELIDAHEKAKLALLGYVEKCTGSVLKPDVLTLGFGRRATAYKRMNLLFQDMERLRAIAKAETPIQVVFSGKAHPMDGEGKALIRQIHQAKAELNGAIPIVYLPEYNMELGKLLTSGVDIWLNTPQPPLEASGTSGMKAALNGVPSLSILDGWWVEGCIEGVTGWAIGSSSRNYEPTVSNDSRSLYVKLEKKILPLFYENKEHFTDIMAQCIALNGSFFHSQRMIEQYVVKAYYK